MSEYKNELDLINESSKLTFELDREKSYGEQAKDLVDVLATQKAVTDDGLLDKVTDLKKEELQSQAETNLKKEKSKSKNAEKELQQSMFGIYEGLASYIGLKRDLPAPMLKILMLFIQPILGVFMLVIGVVVGIINVLMDGINSVIEKFETFAKSTRKIIFSLGIILLIVVFLIVVNTILNKFGIFIF